MIDTRSALEEGRRLFNEGKPFEAHEVWEKAWRVEQGVERLLLQGLIMAAAALVKVSRGEPRGAVKLIESSLRVLPVTSDVFSLEPFRDRLAEALPSLRAWAEGGEPAAPRVTLERR